MREWLVAADDRTGAFEVAALLTAVVGPITVSVGRAPDGSGVVDLGSRAATVVAAGDRARSVDDTPSRWTAHKIDSTLRGHWAAELSARRAATGRRLVLLPGWPEMGRTCVGGQVLVHGEPIGSPLDALPGAALLADADALRAWLRGSGSMAVCGGPDAVSVGGVAREVAEADAEVERFRSQANLFRGGGATSTGLNEQQLTDLTTEVSKARGARGEAEARARAARGLMQRGSVEAIPEVQRSPVIQGLIAQKTRAEREKAEAETTLLAGHPRMKQLYLDYLAGWKQSGGTLMAVFSSMGTYSKWGSWGLLEYHGQPPAEAPKYQAVLEFLHANARWW